MCLDRQWSYAQIDSWLENQPDIVIAYKAVHSRDGRLWPPCYSNAPYETTNRIPDKLTQHQQYAKRTETREDNTTYMAYYHFFLKASDAKIWMGLQYGTDTKIIKCEVPKNLITTIGEHGDKVVLIAKGFTIVGEETCA